MLDQRPIWEAVHRAEAGGWRQRSDFAVEVAALLPAHARILELGCGTGEDAAFFAARGHEVVAVDFAAFAINEAKRRHGSRANPAFLIHDIRQPFDLPAGSFDLVYARLSLHYFPDAAVRAILQEGHRLLPHDGVFAFMCKSTSDPLYGRGREVDTDMFESDHVRHFFSREYAADCLAEGYEAVSLREEGGPGGSAYVIAIARRL